MQEMPTLITVKMVTGQFARHAVIQHPYGSPQGLFEIVGAITTAALRDWTEGTRSFPMRRFDSWVDIEAWLRCILQSPVEHSILTGWNTPRSKHGAKFVFASRYDGPSPEDDFIDLDALFRNTARETWAEAKRDDESDARIEASIGHGPCGPAAEAIIASGDVPA